MSAVKKVLLLLKYIHTHSNSIIDPYDANLQDLIGVTQKQLGRYLQELSEVYDNIKLLKVGKRQVYKLIKPIDVIHEGFKNSLELSMLFEMAKEQMPEVLEDWNRYFCDKNQPYLFFNMPYEDIETLEKNGYFNDLKEAISDQYYCDIYVDNSAFKEAKPLKLIFSDGNWYIAFLINDNLHIRRVNFIEKLVVSSEHFKLKNVDKYLKWFDECFQNSFSQYADKPKKAILLAKPKIGRYFKKGIKKHFKSKEVIKEYADGSVKFSLEYTHPLEILPFIQKWIPNLIILEPQELKEEYKNNLSIALKDS